MVFVSSQVFILIERLFGVLQAKGLDGEYVSLKNVFEIEAAIKTLYSKAQDKLLLLGQFENDAATAKDYKGAATMKRNYVSPAAPCCRPTSLSLPCCSMYACNV